MIEIIVRLSNNTETTVTTLWTEEKKKSDKYLKENAEFLFFSANFFNLYFH